jgi:hypothetical protein
LVCVEKKCIFASNLNAMSKIKIKEALIKDITLYCKMNNIENIEDFINNLLSKAFTIEKYGERPFSKSLKENKKIEDSEIKDNIIKITKPKVKIIEND